jgi:hypothetical protein
LLCGAQFVAVVICFPLLGLSLVSLVLMLLASGGSRAGNGVPPGCCPRQRGKVFSSVARSFSVVTRVILVVVVAVVGLLSICLWFVCVSVCCPRLPVEIFFSVVPFFCVLFLVQVFLFCCCCLCRLSVLFVCVRLRSFLAWFSVLVVPGVA